MSKLGQAIELATELHAGQVDKAGEDYIKHPLRVMNAVEEKTEKIVAVLHVTLEDTNIVFEELEKRFGSVVAVAVKTLSKLTEKIILCLAIASDKTQFHSM